MMELRLVASIFNLTLSWNNQPWKVGCAIQVIILIFGHPEFRGAECLNGVDPYCQPRYQVSNIEGEKHV